MKKGYLDIEKLTNEGWMLFRNIHTQNSIASEMRKLEYFAAPDVVEVVRCKDCVWWDEDDSAGWGDLDLKQKLIPMEESSCEATLFF